MSAFMSAKVRDYDAFLSDFAPGDETTLEGGKPLLFASLSNNKPDPRYRISTFLLDRDARVAGDEPRGDGAFSILFSRRTQHYPQTLDLARRLLAAGADPARPGDRGVTPTHWIAQLTPADDEIRDLLDWWFSLPGLEPGAPNDLGKSPLDLTLDIPEYAHRRGLMENYRG